MRGGREAPDVLRNDSRQWFRQVQWHITLRAWAIAMGITLLVALVLGVVLWIIGTAVGVESFVGTGTGADEAAGPSILVGGFASWFGFVAAAVYVMTNVRRHHLLNVASVPIVHGLFLAVFLLLNWGLENAVGTSLMSLIPAEGREQFGISFFTADRSLATAIGGSIMGFAAAPIRGKRSIRRAEEGGTPEY